MPPVKLKLFKSAGSIDRVRKSMTGTDLMYKQHNYGIGRTISKRAWSKHSSNGDLLDCHWLVTRVFPKQMVRTPFSPTISALSCPSRFLGRFESISSFLPFFPSFSPPFPSSSTVPLFPPTRDRVLHDYPTHLPFGTIVGRLLARSFHFVIFAVFRSPVASDLLLSRKYGNTDPCCLCCIG